MDSTAFSGGPNSPVHSNPIPNGNYTMRLDIRGVLDSSAGLKPDLTPKPFYGVQDIKNFTEEFDTKFNNTWEWGNVRIALNSASDDPEARGQYLHGKERPGDYTHGCISERSEKLLNYLHSLPASTGAVPLQVQ